MKHLSQFWKHAIGAAALLAVIALAPRGFAEAKTAKAKPYPLKVCLVSGEKLNGDMGKPYVFTYNGQEFKLCCRGCQKSFDKNPAKFVKKLADEEKKAQKTDAPAAPHSAH